MPRGGATSPGWHELDRAYVERFLAGWEEPPTDLTLDAASPLDDNLRAVTRHLQRLHPTD